MITLERAYEACYKAHWARLPGRVSAEINSRAAMNHFGHGSPLASITTAKIVSWVCVLRAMGNSQGTINRKLSALSKIMSHAVEAGELEHRPMFPTQPHDEGGRERFLTDEEEREGIANLSNLAARETFAVLIDTGLRPSELWKLKVRDALDGFTTVWRPKNKHPRTIPQTKRVEGIIIERARYKASPDALLFPYSNAWFESRWNVMKERLGLTLDDEFIPYALRHTCASRLVQRGVPLAHVQLWMGHKSIKTTMKYIHLSPDTLKGAVKVLE